MRKSSRAALALGCAWIAAAAAQDAELQAPELDFLEYLGTWAGDDDEWLAIEEWQKDDRAKAGADNRRPERPKRPENDDDDDDETE